MEKKIDNFTYYLDQVIGKGITGEVFLGIDNRNNKQVAVKIIDMTKQYTKIQVDQVFWEIKSLQLLDSPHTLKLLYCQKIDHKQYIITQFCKDGSLDNLLIKNNKKLPVQEAVDIMKQIFYGFAEMQNRKIIHRDFKPMNIFLHEGTAIIGDYGCAISTDDFDYQTSSYFVGTTYYLSPRALMEKFYDEKNDIWALGVTFFQMIMGYLPYYGMYEKEIFQNMKKPIDYSKLPPVSDQVKDFIGKILQMDENKRITLEEIKKHPLFQPFAEPQKCIYNILFVYFNFWGQVYILNSNHLSNSYKEKYKQWCNKFEPQ